MPDAGSGRPGCYVLSLGKSFEGRRYEALGCTSIRLSTSESLLHRNRTAVDNNVYRSVWSNMTPYTATQILCWDLWHGRIVVGAGVPRAAAATPL